MDHFDEWRQITLNNEIRLLEGKLARRHCHCPLPHEAMKTNAVDYVKYLRNIVMDKPLSSFRPKIFITCDCEDIECPICLEPFQDGDEMSKCENYHEMHSHCLYVMLCKPYTNKCCPVCRTGKCIGKNKNK